MYVHSPDYAGSTSDFVKMGVKLLTKLLKTRGHIKHHTHGQDEPIAGIVIDGFAFAFQVYVSSCPNLLARAGAAYTSFHQCCCQQLKQLAALNIPLIVIIDGEAGDYKLATQVARERKKIEFAERMLRGPRLVTDCEVIAPLLFGRALANALEECGVEFLQACGEADQVVIGTS